MDEASRIDLSIVAEPVEPWWQLFRVAEGRTWLLAWRIDPWPIEGGVPEPLALAVTEAFCACGWVAFLSPRVRGLRPQQGWVRDSDRPTRWRHAFRTFLGFRFVHGWRGASLTATADPATATEAFDTASFAWTQQGQIIFLLPPGDLPPVEPASLSALLRGAPGSARSLTGTPVLRGLVLPGVDGCAAQIVAFDPNLWSALEPALRDAAAARGINVRHATETGAFAQPPAESRAGS